MKLLVTGGAGYIGSLVSHRLVQSGHETVVLDNLSKGYGRAVPEEARFARCGLLDERRLRGVLCEGFEGILHFAALSTVAESVEQPGRYYRDNLCGTLGLLEAMRATGAKRLVFSSTAAVYGEPEEVPVTEEAPTAPTNPYGGSKLAADHLIGYEAVAHGLAAVSLRCFDFAGASGRFGNPDASSTQIIPATLRVAAGRGDAAEIFGTDYPTPDGRAVRDFIHVEDLARPPPGTRSGRGGKTEDLQRRQRRGLHRPIKAVRSSRRPGDPAVVVSSNGKIQAELGWKPEKPDLETMISDAWNWIQLHPHQYVPRSARD